jgi:phosphoenolpyruvate-protein kinase (PTS system EI component)
MMEVGRGVKVADHEPVRGVWRSLLTPGDVQALHAEGARGVVAAVRDLSGPFLAPVLTQLAAVVSTEGTRHSHVAIVARARDLPCVVALRAAGPMPADGCEVEVDCSGDGGVVRA